MPSHLAPSDPSTPEMVEDIGENFISQPPIPSALPLIDQFGIMLIVGTIIIAGIFVFIVLRRRKK